MSNSNKGTSSLASVLQRRISMVGRGITGISVEMGEIVHGNKLKLSSIPGAILDRNDYSICAGISTRNSRKCVCEDSPSAGVNYSLKTGDKVLIVWTFDGEPVIVDKIVT